MGNVADNPKIPVKAGNCQPPAPRWKPGQSGNPLGKPKLPPGFTEKLVKAGPAALDTMIELAQSGPAVVRVRAAEWLLERLMGKAPQPLCGPDGGAIQVQNLVILPQLGIPELAKTQAIDMVDDSSDDSDGQ